MTRRLLPAICVMLLVASSSGGQASGEPQASATTWRLASAQVVTSTVAPPVLKLTASGPIAFETLPVDASGNPVGPDRVVARLFGVAPGDLASSGSSGDLAPFGLTATAAASANATDTDTILTITTGAVSATSGQKLVLRAGLQSNVLEAVIVAAH